MNHWNLVQFITMYLNALVGQIKFLLLLILVLLVLLTLIPVADETPGQHHKMGTSPL